VSSMVVARDEIQEIVEAMAAWIERRKLDGKLNLEIARIVTRVQMGLWECADDRRSLVVRTLAEDVADLERAVARAHSHEAYLARWSAAVLCRHSDRAQSPPPRCAEDAPALTIAKRPRA
jgi:hypothetical protein